MKPVWWTGGRTLFARSDGFQALLRGPVGLGRDVSRHYLRSSRFKRVAFVGSGRPRARRALLLVLSFRFTQVRQYPEIVSENEHDLGN